jgi:hypothetical protein
MHTRGAPMSKAGIGNFFLGFKIGSIGIGRG